MEYWSPLGNLLSICLLNLPAFGQRSSEMENTVRGNKNGVHYDTGISYIIYHIYHIISYHLMTLRYYCYFNWKIIQLE